MTRRPAQVQVGRRSYTHTVCCLAEHKADKVLLKADLLTSGLGEQKVTFQVSMKLDIYHKKKLKQKTSLCLWFVEIIFSSTLFLFSHKYFMYVHVGLKLD